MNRQGKRRRGRSGGARQGKEVDFVMSMYSNFTTNSTDVQPSPEALRRQLAELDAQLEAAPDDDFWVEVYQHWLNVHAALVESGGADE